MKKSKISTIGKRILTGQDELTTPLIQEVVTTVLEETTQDSINDLQKLLAQKDKLEHEIKLHTQRLQELRQENFSEIEQLLRDYFPDIEAKDLKTLTQLKIQSIDILDLLQEITEAAFISALENGENIEASFKEISRDLTHKTLRSGYLTLDRARKVIATIIATAAEMAEATPNHAHAILKGSLYGSKKGLAQSIHTFKEHFSYIPDELEPEQIKSMRQTYEDLQHTDVIFMQIVQAQADLSAAVINKTMSDIVERMRPDLSELISVSKETLTLVGDRLGKLGKKAILRSEKVLHSSAAIEAKRMGVNVWDVAKGAIEGAINSAKDVIETKKNKK